MVARARSPRTDPTPLYFRLRHVLLSGIESLAYGAAGRLPGERDLAAQFGVSRTTVRQALDMLAREGVVRRARGRRGGTFVSRPPEIAPRSAGSFESLFAPEHVRRIEVLAFERRAGSPELCAALHVPPGSEVQYIERVIVGADGPIAYDRAFLPPSVGARLRRGDLRRRLLHELLRGKPDLKAAEVRHEVEARVADAITARRLGIGVGRPVLLVRRTLLAPGDEPIYVSIIAIAGERHTMRLRQRWT